MHTTPNGTRESRPAATNVISFKADDALLKAIKRAARADGRLVSPFLRRVLKHLLDEGIRPGSTG